MAKMFRNNKTKVKSLLLLFIVSVVSIVVFYHHVGIRKPWMTARTANINEGDGFTTLNVRETTVSLENNPDVRDVDDILRKKWLQIQSELYKNNGGVNATPTVSETKAPLENNPDLWNVDEAMHAKLLQIHSALYNKNGSRRETEASGRTKRPLKNTKLVNEVNAKLLKIQSMVNTKDGWKATQLSTKTKSTLESKPVVYNVDVLYTKLLQIHSELYNKTNSECILRDPKCVVLGVAKSGTQELVDFASMHPNIVLKPGLSTPEMFSMDKTKRRHAMQNAHKPVPCSHADQIVIAKSDGYLFRPEMPQLLYRFNPNLKMILIVREPVARMISGFTFSFLQRKQHRERFIYRPEDIPEMDKWFVNPSNGQVFKNQELDSSTYYAGLERYLKVFPLEQILVIESNELKTDPVRVLQKVEIFLNLQPVFTDDLFAYVEEKGFYCLNSDKIYCYGSDRGRAVMKELRPETKSILKSYFEPLNKKFFKLIGRTFDW